MLRYVFFSFHYKPDNWRAAQVRSMGVVEGNRPANDNDWESITRGGDAAIARWINNQLFGRSCTIVLIGRNTAGRKWINYEIQKSWKGLLGIHIHNLKDRNGFQSYAGRNPFSEVNIGQCSLSNIVKVYNPPYSDSRLTYQYIQQNVQQWIEDAITIRRGYS